MFNENRSFYSAGKIAQILIVSLQMNLLRE